MPQSQFIVNRRRRQEEHLKTIWRLFNGQVRALVPLFETEIREVESLIRLSNSLFA